MTEVVNQETGEITESTERAVAETPVDARCALWSAFIKAQSTMEAPKRTKKADVKNASGTIIYSFPYAPLDEVLDAAKKPLGENGLAVHQRIVQRNGRDYVRTQIIHTSGEYSESDYPLILGNNPTAQNYGGAVTYARRYGLLLALGMAAEDDDANASSGNTAVISDRNRGTTQQPQTQDRGQPQDQQRQRPPQTQTQQPNPDRDAANAANQRISNAIDNARSTEELNHAWTPEDEKLIRSIVHGSDRIGDRVWKRLMDREADKRLKLVEDEYEDGNTMEPDDGFMRPEDTGRALG